MKAKERNPNHLEHDNIDEGASGKSLQDRSHLVMMTIMMILSKKMMMMVTHHDKIPPWWGNVSNDEGGNVSVSKTHHTP